MSLLGYNNDDEGATLNGLNNINANFVFGDELYYDVSTTPVNVKTAINGITVDVTALEADVLTLQGEMNTAQSDINTLQSEMNTAQSDINTLQSEMNDAQADIGALYGITATNTASIAGLVISQASQDVTISAHTASIAGLTGDVNTLQSDVTALQVKTTAQSWGSLSGTTFSGKVNIGTTSSGVTLNTSSASTFGSGISASSNISTTGILSSTAGTSSLDSLLVNNNFEVTNISYFGDTLYCDRNALTSNKKLVLYDANTGNNYDYLGFWTDSGTASKKFLNAEIDGVAGSAFNWYYGNNLGSSRTLAKTLTSADEINYTPQATFLKSSGFSQQIQLVRDTANNKVRIDMIGDTAGLNVYDGQIIQREGNGVDDNRGLMTIQSGDVTLNALTSATTGTLQLNSKVLDINNSGAITIDGASTTVITSVDDLTIQTTNPFGDILVSSAGTTTLTSTGTTQINSVALDINASGALTIDPLTFTMNATALTGTAMTWQSNTTGSDLILSNATAGAFSIESGAGQNLQFKTTGAGDLDFISSGDMFFNSTSTFGMSGTGVGITASIDNVNISSTLGGVILTSKLDTDITSSNGGVNITATTGDVNLTGTDVVITTTGTGVGEFVVRANTNVDIKTTTGNIELWANTTMLSKSGGTNTLEVSGANKMVTTSTTTTLTNDTIVIGNKNELYGTPLSTTGATVSPTFPLESLYMITGTTASNRNYVLPTATATNAGAIFKLVNLVPSNTVDYTITISTTGTQYLTLGNGDATLLLQSYQLQMDETSVEFIYNGSNYWVCMSPRPVIPTGTIISYPIAMNLTTFGLQNRFVLCNGASLNATANPKYFNLWKVIGTTFGGTGVTAFSLPDLQGTVLKGAGTKTVSQTSNSNAGGTLSVAHTATISAFQTDATLVIRQAGYWSAGSGGGAQSRSRTRIAGDGEEENPTNDTSTYVDRYADEVRVYNMGVNWYMKL